jgi:exopolysaccharide biosynthesis protein
MRRIAVAASIGLITTLSACATATADGSNDSGIRDAATRALQLVKERLEPPLGRPGLPSSPRPAETIAPGVTYAKYTRGYVSDKWTVEVGFKGRDRMMPVRADADSLAAELRARGYVPRVETISAPAMADAPAGPVAYTTRVGQYEKEAEANIEAAKLRTTGYEAKVAFTAADGAETTGPWTIRILTVDPRAAIAIGTTDGRDLESAETVPSMAARERALVAVNGSFFATGSGDPLGIYVRNGRLLSEAFNGRTALILDGTGKTRITELSTEITMVASDGTRRGIDGVNRPPGKIPGCGGVGAPTDGMASIAQPQRTCVNPDEVVQFTSDWGTETPPGGGMEAVLDSSSVVQELRWTSGPIPSGGSVLRGIGQGAEWLTTHATPGSRISISTRILDPAGVALPLTPSLNILSAGPALIRGGKVWINVKANGMTSSGTGTGNLTATLRHPRTMAGVDAAGRLLLVTVDGRRPAKSVGLTLTEGAALMRWLGAVDAVNLDGGGSTSLVIDGRLRNEPVDDWQEYPHARPVGNAIVLTAKRG